MSMIRTLAVLGLALVASQAHAQQMTQRFWQPRNGNLDDIAALADPGAARVLKWNDSTNEIEWAVDATGGGGGGDVDGFAADPSSNGNFSSAAWITDLGLAGLYQPLDSDLTAIAALTTTSFGRSLLDDADAAAGRTTLGATAGVWGDALIVSTIARDSEVASLFNDKFADPSTETGFDAAEWIADLGLASIYQPLDSDLTTWAGVTSSANGRSLVSAADYSAMRTLLSLVPGTNVQTQDAFLQDIADLTDPGASRVLKWNDSTNEIEWAVDETAGSGGSGTVNSIKGNGTQVGGSDIVTLDFSSEFGVSESPDTEINITIDAAITRDSEVTSAFNDAFGDPSSVSGWDSAEWRSAMSVPATADLDTSSELRTLVTDENGTGALLFDGASPAFVDVDASAGTLTANDPFTFAATWNNGAVGFSGVDILITDTASANASYPLRVRGGASAATDLFYVDKFGRAYVGGNTLNLTGTNLRSPTAGVFQVMNSGSPTSAGTLDVFNTWTSDSNFESGGFTWSSNVLQVGSRTVGGTARNVALSTGGTNRLVVNASTGHITPGADSTQNLGASGTEFLNVYSDTVTAGALAGNAWTKLQKKTRTFVLFGPTTDAATGDGAAYYPIPPELNGANITYVHLWAVTAGTTGTSDVQIARVRSGTPADVLSTKVTIDSTEQGSDTAASAAVINTSNDDVATNDVLRVDVDALSTTKPRGLIVTIGFELQ
jgi:hypothetical protein